MALIGDPTCESFARGLIWANPVYRIIAFRVYVWDPHLGKLPYLSICTYLYVFMYGYRYRDRSFWEDRELAVSLANDQDASPIYHEGGSCLMRIAEKEGPFWGVVEVFLAPRFCGIPIFTRACLKNGIPDLNIPLIPINPYIIPVSISFSIFFSI